MKQTNRIFYFSVLIGLILIEFIVPLFEDTFFSQGLFEIANQPRRPFFTLFYIVIYTSQPYLAALWAKINFKISQNRAGDYFNRFLSFFYLSTFLNLLNNLLTSLGKQYLATKSIDVKDIEQDRLVFTFDIVTNFFVSVFDEMLIPLSEVLGVICFIIFLKITFNFSKKIIALITLFVVPAILNIYTSYLQMFNYDIQLTESMFLSDVEGNGAAAKITVIVVTTILALFYKKDREKFL